MDWVKIEEGCELPEIGEIVIIADHDSWTQASWCGSSFHPVDEHDYVCMSDNLDGATHWARVDMPNN